MTKFLLLIILFISTQMSQAQKEWRQETNLYPIQPILVHNDCVSYINPFKVSALNIGIGGLNLPLRTSDFNQLTKFTCFPNKRNFTIQLQSEVPFYKHWMSLGWDSAFAVYGQEEHPLTVMVVGDVLKIAKFKWTFFTALGAIALTMTPKTGICLQPIAGIVSKLYRADALDMNYMTEMKAMKRTMSIQGGKLYFDGTWVGWTSGIGFGLDYYWNQWIGAYAEVCIKHRYLGLFIEKTKRPNPPDSFGYWNSSFTIGIKTTF